MTDTLSCSKREPPYNINQSWLPVQSNIPPMLQVQVSVAGLFSDDWVCFRAKHGNICRTRPVELLLKPKRPKRFGGRLEKLELASGDLLPTPGTRSAVEEAVRATEEVLDLLLGVHLAATVPRSTSCEGWRKHTHTHVSGLRPGSTTGHVKPTGRRV